MLTATAHRALVIVLLALGSLVGFTGCSNTPSATDLDSSRTLTTFGNTNWVLVQWISANGDEQPIIPPAPTMRLGYQGRVSGQAGVNEYLGTAKVSKGLLDWGKHLAVTRLDGSPELMKSEGRFLDDLKATIRVTVLDDRLVFTGKKNLRLEFARARH